MWYLNTLPVDAELQWGPWKSPCHPLMSDEFIVFKIITEIMAELKMNAFLKCFMSYCFDLHILSTMQIFPPLLSETLRTRADSHLAVISWAEAWDFV